ncbi:MAG TPA: response regulator [Allosphingosinicella sp.]|nr:response regulator [Allosphingosinicella sp.]
MTGELAGKRILIVEDEPIIAMLLEDMLRDFGCEVVGPVLRLAEARATALDERLDGAILDVNLGDGPSFSVAAILAGRGIPFCFSTGYGESAVPPEFGSAPVLQKPYRQDVLAAHLARCLAPPRCRS